ncbi:MAG: flagellar filament capping protein FliD [Nitrospirota bacterium]
MATSPTGGSGLDINSIVSQLMQIEQRPLQRLQQRQADYQAKISAYATLLNGITTLKGAVSALKGASLGMSASLSDSTYLTASASSTAAAGTHTVQVGALASAQSVYSIRFGSSSGAVADLSTVMSQKLKLQVGTGTAKEITIDSTNNTLSGIRDAINTANAGVTAAIVKETDKFIIEAGKNDTVQFSDGSARTATIAAGTYTGAELATALQTALNGAGSTNTFAVDYNSTSLNKFTIKNDGGPAAVDLLWSDAGSTARQMLGFNVPTSTVAVGASATADSTADGTYKLTLASSMGASNRIVLQVDEDNDGTYTDAGAEADTFGLSALAFNPTYDAEGATNGGIRNMEQSAKGVDAKVKVNGIELFRGTNSISDVIEGITLNLVKADSNYPNGTAATLTVTQDTGALSVKISSFMGAYNQAMTAIKGLKGTTGQFGVLRGDSILTTLASTMKSITTTRYGNYETNNTLTWLGITHDKTGVLSFDSAKLTAALTADPSKVTDMLDKMATAYESTLNGYINTSIPSGQDGYKTRMKSVQLDMENMTKRLEKTEAGLRKKFINLDTLLTQLQGTGNYVTQQMDWLKKSFGGK